MSRSTRPVTQLDSQGRVLPSSGDWTTFRGEYTGANLIYSGFAKPGSDESIAVWQIAKLAYDGTGNLLSMKYPVNSSGAVSSDFEFKWSDRASYSYL